MSPAAAETLCERVPELRDGDLVVRPLTAGDAAAVAAAVPAGGPGAWEAAQGHTPLVGLAASSRGGTTPGVAASGSRWPWSTVTTSRARSSCRAARQRRRCRDVATLSRSRTGSVPRHAVVG